MMACCVSADIKFFKKLENKTERETGTLQLDCKASNPHSAPVTWLKDGKPINKDDPYVVLSVYALVVFIV